MTANESPAIITHQQRVAAAAEELRAWAKGMYHTEAAAELLIRAFGGRFAVPGNPWVHERESDGLWIDGEDITANTIGQYSGGERRMLSLVAAILDRRSIDLGDVAAGLSRRNLALALAAIAHAGGSHQHNRTVLSDDRRSIIGFQSLASLFPWDVAEAAGGTD